MAGKTRAPEAPVGVDLGSLDVAVMAEEGVWFVPLHPTTGDPLDCRLRVFGEDSKAYGRAMNRIADMRAAAQRTRRTTDLTYDDVQAAELVLATHLTGAWEGLTEGEEPLDCTPENKSRVFKQHRWLAEQVVAFARNRANFLMS